MVLMIVSLIGLLGLRVVYNNEVHRALKIDKSDLYKAKINYAGDMEEIITLINIYSMKNKEIINETKNSGVTKSILDKVATIKYLQDIDIFKVIYNKGIRYDFNLRYKVVDGTIYFLPEEKYMVLERK